MLRRTMQVGLVILVVAAPVGAQIMLCEGGPPSVSVTGPSGPYIAAQCTLDAGTDGTILIIASSSVNRADTEHTQLSLRLGIDTAGGLGLVASERVVDVYGTAYLERQNTMASVAVPVIAGSHTLYYFAERVTGTATVTLYRPRILAIFIPSAETNMRVCEGRHVGEYTTTAASQTLVATCTLQNLGAGSALVTGDGWMQLSDTDAEMSVGIHDNVPVSIVPGTARWSDAVGDVVYDGVDNGFATSYLATPAPGTAVFHTSVGRSGGAGTVSVMWPGVAALWAATGGPVIANGSVLGGEWTTTSIAPVPMLQTTLNTSVGGYFLIVGTASVGPDAEDYTAHFKATVDFGDDIANRYVRISDAIDRSLALTDLVPVEAGNHTIRLSGGRYDTTAGTNLRVRDGSLAVMFFPSEMVAIFGDGFEVGSVSNWSSVVP